MNENTDNTSPAAEAAAAAGAAPSLEQQLADWQRWSASADDLGSGSKR